jgi:hypothetical protein
MEPVRPEFRLTILLFSEFENRSQLVVKHAEVYWKNICPANCRDRKGPYHAVNRALEDVLIGSTKERLAFE